MPSWRSCWLSSSRRRWPARSNLTPMRPLPVSLPGNGCVCSVRRHRHALHIGKHVALVGLLRSLESEGLRIRREKASRPAYHGLYRRSAPDRIGVCAGERCVFHALGPVAWTNVSGNLYRPSQNPYTSVGYYYLTDDGAPDDAERLVPPQRAFTQVSDESSNLRVNTFYDRLFHEKDLESPGEAGFFMVGEDFRYQTKQTFDFTLTDLAEPLKELQDDESAKEIPTVNIEFSFVALTISGASQLTYTANGTTLTEAAVDRIEGVSGDSHYTHGRQSLSRKDYMARSEKLSLGVNYRSSGTVSRSNLNYIAIAYLRKLQLPASRNLDIYLSSRSDARLANTGFDTRVSDMSDPTDIRAMETKMINDSLQWGATSTRRTYAAWEARREIPLAGICGAGAQPEPARPPCARHGDIYPR